MIRQIFAPPSPVPEQMSFGVDVVGDGIEFDAVYDFIDVADTTITLGNNNRHCGGGFGGCPFTLTLGYDFFGYRIVDVLDQIDPIVGVSLVSSSDPGFEIADVSFSENDIFIGIEHLGGYPLGDVIPHREVVLSVSFATTLPEPGTLAVFGLGLAGLALLRGRRRTCRTVGFAVSAVAVLLSHAPSAHAGFIGESIEIFDVSRSSFAIPGSPPTETSLGVSVAGSQFEYDGLFDFIDVADTTITIGNDTRHCVGIHCPFQIGVLGDFFGFRIVDVFDQIDPIAGVSLLTSSIAGFEIADVSFSENDIFIGIEDLGGYSFGNAIPDGQAVLSVTFAAAALPEPGTLTVFGGGLAVLAWLRRRRAR